MIKLKQKNEIKRKGKMKNHKKIKSISERLGGK